MSIEFNLLFHRNIPVQGVSWSPLINLWTMFVCVCLFVCLCFHLAYRPTGFWYILYQGIICCTLELTYTHKNRYILRLNNYMTLRTLEKNFCAWSRRGFLIDKSAQRGTFFLILQYINVECLSVCVCVCLFVLGTTVCLCF